MLVLTQDEVFSIEECLSLDDQKRQNLSQVFYIA